MWLLQDVGRHHMIKKNFDTVRALNVNYRNFGVGEGNGLLFTDDSRIDEPCIVRGGVKAVELVHAAQHISDIAPGQFLDSDDRLFHRFKKSVFYDKERFDYAYYGTMDLPLLNDKAIFYPLADILSYTFDSDVFIKPSSDLKYFNGGVLPKNETVQDFIMRNNPRFGYEQEIVMVAPLHVIKHECRFFVVNRHVITGSTYRKEDVLHVVSDIPRSLLETAQEYAQLYQPADIFTLDLCQTEGDIRIIEYNCFNCSGLYEADAVTLFQTVNDSML